MMFFNSECQFGDVDHASSLRRSFFLKDDIGRFYFTAIFGIGIAKKFGFEFKLSPLKNPSKNAKIP